MVENHLIHETSPYLLQHAENPVDWYGWNDEALKKAKDENKPIFLSIGYSSCHWCHVMAHESFENDDVAEFMNEHFVNIKVDREERPDIDDIYQKVCQIATGQGGWPLSIFLTPDQKPFYVGTYFPVLDSYGRPGFGSICRQLAQAWKEKPKDIEKSAESFIYALHKTEKISEPTTLAITRPRAPGSGFVGPDEAPRPAAASFRAPALPDPASSSSSSPQPATSRRSRVYWTSSTPSPMQSSTPRRRRSEPRSCAPQRSARRTRA